MKTLEVLQNELAKLEQKIERIKQKGISQEKIDNVLESIVCKNYEIEIIENGLLETIEKYDDGKNSKCAILAKKEIGTYGVTTEHFARRIFDILS